jgi:hypothetical protein
MMVVQTETRSTIVKHYKQKILCRTVIYLCLYPNRSYEIERVSHLPTRPGDLLTIDLYAPLPTGRGGVKYLWYVWNSSTYM